MMNPENGFLPRPDERFRRRLLYTLEKFLYWSGLGYMHLKTRHPQGAVILTYHSITAATNAVWIDPRNRLSPKLFERQMRFLAANRRVISMNELLDTLTQEGASLPAGSVVLTFDDGYRDNFEVAAPILQRYELPALMYVPTGQVTRGESPWADELYTIFRTRTRQTFRMLPDVTPMDLRDSRTSRTVYRRISRELIVADCQRRQALLASVGEQLKPLEKTPRLTLSWDELRVLRARYPLFELGVHSANHLDFTSQEETVVRQDLLECMADFERELGVPAEHFAYPYDRRNDGTDQLVAEAGLRSAVASGPNPLISSSCDPYNLPRIGDVRSMSLYRFWTSGAYPDLPKILFGRA